MRFVGARPIVITCPGVSRYTSRHLLPSRTTRYAIMSNAQPGKQTVRGPWRPDPQLLHYSALDVRTEYSQTTPILGMTQNSTIRRNHIDRGRFRTAQPPGNRP